MRLERLTCCLDVAQEHSQCVLMHNFFISRCADRWTLAFGYFFALFITVLAHRDVYDNIWKETIYTVAWLESGVDGAISRIDKDLEKAKRSKDWDVQSGEGDVDQYDMETASAKVRRFLSAKPRDEPAPWAQQLPVKRGVDRPFSRTATPAATPAPGTEDKIKQGTRREGA